MTVQLSSTDRDLIRKLTKAMQAYNATNGTAWVGIATVKKMLGEVDKEQMRKWRNTGALSYKREGGKVMYSLDSVKHLKQAINP